MVSKIDWESQIGRRLRLRDLHVLFTVVHYSSMAKAAAHLGVSQPSVSEVIADLEYTLGVRLLDRSSKGVEPTIYARTLLSRARIAFDELKQGVRDIEFLSQPATGEVHIGAPESLASSVLPAMLQTLSRDYPRITAQVDAGPTETVITRLLQRELDLVLARGMQPASTEQAGDLDTEILFNDELVFVAAKNSRWGNRRRLTLAELANEPWILSPPGTWNYAVVSDAFQTAGLGLPKIGINTLSIHVRCNLVASAQVITVLPRSVLWLYGELFGLTILPLGVPARPWPVKVVTLKNRTLTPVVQRFLDCARAVCRQLPTQHNAAAAV